MKSRILLITAMLIGGFVLYTNQRGAPRFRRAMSGGGGQVWSEPELVHGAGLGSDELNNIEVYKLANQATVNITSTIVQQDWFRGVYSASAAGSGFAIDPEGKILTNNHVISGSSKVEVVLADQSSYTAEILSRDPINDLALIQIRPKKKIPFLRLGDSDKLQVGQKVLAIGNPFRLNGTLTVGVVSALDREISQENNRLLEGLIQTDAAINHGNSGGPLLDSQGSVIGINSAILGQANIGIGFAMPINKAKVMLEDFQAGRQYKRPQLGIQTYPVSGDVAAALELPVAGGLLIQGVVRGSAADMAGLRGPKRTVIVGNIELRIDGDLIMAIDGKAVENRPDALAAVLARKRAGDLIDLTIFRDGKQSNVKVKLGEAPEDRI